MAGAERVFLATPIPTAGARVIATPFQFWTSGEDNLRVLSVNSLSNVRLTVQGRFLTPDGTITAARHDHTPNSDRTVVTTESALGVGAVLNLVVYATGATPRIGQTFVIVQLIRGRGAAAVVLGILLQGYVTSTQALAWPGSPILTSLEGNGYPRDVFGTNPAAGQEISETVPTGARWQLLLFQAQFTASATVATRRPSLSYNIGGQQVGRSVNVTDITASQSGTFNWATGFPLTAPIQPGINNAALPNELVLLAGDSVATITTNLQAGDQWTNPRYVVREWLEVP